MSESTGSTISSSRAAQARLTTISSHISTGKLPKVVVCRDLGPDVMPILTNRKDIEVVLWPEDRACEREWLLKNIKGATGVLVMLSDIVNEEFLQAAGPTLRVVSTMSVGYEHVDLKQIAKRNVRLGYTPEVLTEAVADLSIMLALMAGRNVNEVWPSREKVEFTWSPFALCGPQLSTTPDFPKRTIGFLGFGRISQATLTRALAFGVTDCIYYANPSSAPKIERDAALLKEHHPKLKSLRAVDLDALARESDVVIVLAPGGEQTKHIVNEDFLKKMKKHAVLVNTARGTLVDSDALAKALRERWIWGAGIDVVEGEPNVPADHPLLKEPRCNVLPHIASATLETRLGMATLAANNVLAGVLEDKMPAELNTS